MSKGNASSKAEAESGKGMFSSYVPQQEIKPRSEVNYFQESFDMTNPSLQSHRKLPLAVKVGRVPEQVKEDKEDK